MNFVNLTPHVINLPTGPVPSSGLARVKETTFLVGNIAGIPIVSKAFGEVTGLPTPTPDTIYIVSAMVAAAVQRVDVMSPGDLVRDEEGRITGCSSLCSYVKDETA